jgi:hypothetical protein
VPPCRLFCAAPPVVAVPRELLLFAVAVTLGHSTASFVISGGALSLGSDPMVRCVGEEAATRARVVPTGAARRWDTTSEPTAPGWRRRRRGRVRILRGATRPSGHEWSVPRPLLLPQGCRRRASWNDRGADVLRGERRAWWKKGPRRSSSVRVKRGCAHVRGVCVCVCVKRAPRARPPAPPPAGRFRSGGDAVRGSGGRKVALRAERGTARRVRLPRSEGGRGGEERGRESPTSLVRALALALVGTRPWEDGV